MLLPVWKPSTKHTAPTPAMPKNAAPLFMNMTPGKLLGTDGGSSGARCALPCNNRWSKKTPPGASLGGRWGQAERSPHHAEPSLLNAVTVTSAEGGGCKRIFTGTAPTHVSNATQALRQPSRGGLVDRAAAPVLTWGSPDGRTRVPLQAPSGSVVGACSNRPLSRGSAGTAMSPDATASKRGHHGSSPPGIEDGHESGLS